MTDVFVLESENFRLSLDFQIFEEDIPHPVNTTLSIHVSSAGFSASTTMDIDIKDIPIFCKNLKNIYASLTGTAKIQEPFGKQHILFAGDKLGHIAMSGHLHSNGICGFWQELKFENAIDQTFLPPFLEYLTNISQMFIE